ncbi:MAG TPA: hypothetical protein PLW68_14815 [Casimicrobiaceae bacterium]|nr:hypothetical protein [Casimicrobiaceae bacterium]
MNVRILVSVSALLIAGCASGPPFIDQMQPEAVNMAVRRAQFELSCPKATGQVISRETLQPVVQTFRYSGPERAEYTVGVEGCGQRATYVVICPDNGSMSCYAAAGRMGGR